MINDGWQCHSAWRIRVDYMYSIPIPATAALAGESKSSDDLHWDSRAKFKTSKD